MLFENKTKEKIPVRVMEKNGRNSRYVWLKPKKTIDVEKEYGEAIGLTEVKETKEEGNEKETETKTVEGKSGNKNVETKKIRK